MSNGVKINIAFDLDYPLKRHEFTSDHEFRTYLSRNREAELKVHLQKMKFQLMDHGLTGEEWSRVLCEFLSDFLRRRP